ncbi:GNAT family N-acetyltransferase [Anabaena sp. UHCC 0451]|uniref:GNAT family N-acetyltransferase n=1 Tax=Anabaena sp. UHCC 0451 TaxID=2055235 RepID=UPI002B20EC8E|nr:GNAT family N-acetyltransferase [Anabaena sp. UHCC 0451]MEA5578696.1 GNAT family N-acetyltransferase [Anabaena sp. UHCC 0451]
MEYLHFEIFTDRLLIKAISLKYKEEIFREFTPKIATYLYAAPAKEIEGTEFFINQSLLEMQKGENLIVVILKKDSQEFLGCSGINDLQTPHPQTGIWLKKIAHGQGYGTEVIKALKEWAEQNLDYEYLRYPVARENTASRRIPEKLGGQINREYSYTNLSGRVLNIIEYIMPKPIIDKGVGL